MSTSTDQRPELGLNPSVLKWAREWSGKSLLEVATKFGKDESQIQQWEEGVAEPTLRQARALAAFYGRSFLEFLFSDLPPVTLPQLVPDYRVHTNKIRDANKREIASVQAWAEAQRANALDLYLELGEEPPAIASELLVTVESSPEYTAPFIREALDFSLADQIDLDADRARKVPALLRAKFEGAGILTLRNAHLKRWRVRGICLADYPLPVIVITSEAPAAQAFTLAHELAHVLTRHSAILGSRSKRHERKPVERWCDRFAGAFLMPKREVTPLFGAVPSVPAPSISDSDLRQLARRFSVSRHAMLVRLVHLNYVNADYYWRVKKKALEKEDLNYSGGGPPEYYGAGTSRLRERYTPA